MRLVYPARRRSFVFWKVQLVCHSIHLNHYTYPSELGFFATDYLRELDECGPLDLPMLTDPPYDVVLPMSSHGANFILTCGVSLQREAHMSVLTHLSEN